MKMLSAIERAVCSQFEISQKEFRERKHRTEQHVAEAKHAAVLLASLQTRMNPHALSKRLKMHHSMVQYAVKHAQSLIDVDPDYRARYERAKSLLTPTKR
jgi:hypothetical protein